MCPIPFLSLVAAGATVLAAAAGAQCPSQTLPFPYVHGFSAGGDVMVATPTPLGMYDGDGAAIPFAPVYRRAGGLWTYDEHLLQSHSTIYSCGLWTEYDKIGDAVDVDDTGARIAVGAPWNNVKRGAVTIFVESGGTWTEEAFLADPAAAPGFCGESGYQLGGAVAIDGQLLVAAAQAAGGVELRVYRRAGGVWGLEALLPTSAEPVEYGGLFEERLDVDGERIALGDSGTNSVLIFERSGGSWVQTATLVPAGLHPNQNDLRWVALDGDVLAASAPDYDWDAPDAGAAVIFRLGAGGWTQEATLTQFDAQPGAQSLYGSGVHVRGERVLVGDLEGAYIYDFRGGSWVLDDKHEVGYRGVLLSGGQTVSAYNDVHVVDDAVPACVFNTDTVSVSVGAGGAQTWTLVHGPGSAGLVYFILGTLSGTSPGLDAGALHLPLNPDVYMLWTLNHPNTAPLVASFGILDAVGGASASFVLPPGSDPSLVGLLAHHADVTIDPVALDAVATSNAVATLLVP